MKHKLQETGLKNTFMNSYVWSYAHLLHAGKTLRVIGLEEGEGLPARSRARPCASCSPSDPIPVYSLTQCLKQHPRPPAQSYSILCGEPHQPCPKQPPVSAHRRTCDGSFYPYQANVFFFMIKIIHLMGSFLHRACVYCLWSHLTNTENVGSRASPSFSSSPSSFALDHTCCRTRLPSG